MYNWTVITTSHNNNYGHIEHTKFYNPNAQIMMADTSKYCRMFGDLWSYRNNDSAFRNWLKKNIDSIQNHNVAIFDWDVLCKMELPNDFPLGNEIIVKEHIPYSQETFDWWWFSEYNKLQEFKAYACGIQPLGVLFTSKDSLTKLLDPKLDKLFKSNIFCELRFPTVCNYLGIKINTFTQPQLEFIRTRPDYSDEIKEFKIGYIYHPVKKDQTL